MKVLGIDYGRAKIGLAIGEAGFAVPLNVIRVSRWEEAIDKVEKVVKVEKVEQVVVGVTEREMGKEQERFAKELGGKLSISVETQDETLSTFDAQQMAIQGGVPLKKRKKLEDAFAAAVMLQSWLDAQSAS